MRIAVVGQIRPGSSRAHAINTIKTAGGFARLGHEVACYTMACELPDPGAIYHEPSLTWVEAPEPEGDNPDECFGRWAANRILSDGCEFVYARNFWAPLLTAEAGLPTVVETHAYIGSVNPLLDRTLCATRTLDALRAVITIAPPLRDHFIERGARADRVRVVPDGVDFDLFTSPCANPYETPGPRAVYAGHLYAYKGIFTILDAAATLPHVRFELVGGLPEDLRRTQRAVMERRLSNVVLHGLVPHALVPGYVCHADALLLPPSAAEPSKDWTSPVKLGEYLATGVPIAASSIPALTRVLNEPLVRFFKPDDGVALAHTIEACLCESPEDPARERRIEQARTLSYSARAATILDAAGLAEARTAA